MEANKRNTIVQAVVNAIVTVLSVLLGVNL